MYVSDIDLLVRHHLHNKQNHFLVQYFQIFNSFLYLKNKQAYKILTYKTFHWWLSILKFPHKVVDSLIIFIVALREVFPPESKKILELVADPDIFSRGSTDCIIGVCVGGGVKSCFRNSLHNQPFFQHKGCTECQLLALWE